MKIAMLIDGWDPVFGGGQTHVKFLSELLVTHHNCTVDLFVRKLTGLDHKKYTHDESYLHGKWKIFRMGPCATFFNVPLRILSLCNTTIFLFWKAVRQKYDIIHAHAYVSGLPAKIVGYLLHIPVVYTVNGTMGLDANKKGFLAKVERWLICGIRYDLEISVAHKIFDYKNKNKNIKIIYNGVDLKTYDSVHIDKKHAGVGFLFVGRFGWQKGLEYLIQGLALVDKPLLSQTGFILNLVGDGELRDTLHAMVEEHRLQDFVRFVGPLSGDALIKEYKSNHVFILPSLAEGQPLTILEAFAAGLPVITTRTVGENEYFINDGENGFLIHPSNALDIKKSIEHMLYLDKDALQTLGHNGYRNVGKYTRETIVTQIYDEYGLLLKK